MSAEPGAVAEPTVLAAERPCIDETLAGIVATAVPRLAEPLRAPAEYALASVGKRIRPTLCVAAWRAAASATPGSARPTPTDRAKPLRVPPAVYRLACAVELVHTYSLIHDDLPCMDDDDLRRGRPTVHRVFGEQRAMLVGAALLPLAVEVFAESVGALGLSPKVRGEIFRDLMRAAGAEGMVGGQLLDLEAEGRDVEPGELERIHRLKTGALLVASLRVGATAGGADAALLDALSRYGEALGLAFQIADDLLDVEGSASDLGKTSGRDELLQKASYPGLYGVDGARAMARHRVDEAILAVEPYGLMDLVEVAEYVLSRRV